MEYDDVIQILGELGTYQKLVLFSLSFAMAFRAYPTFIANFIAGSHSHRYILYVWYQYHILVEMKIMTGIQYL